MLDRIRILLTGRMGHRLAGAVADRTHADLFAVNDLLHDRVEYVTVANHALVDSVVHLEAQRQNDAFNHAEMLATHESDMDNLRHDLSDADEALRDAKAGRPCGWADVMVESSVLNETRRGLDPTVSTDVARGRVALRIVSQHLTGVLAEGTSDLKLVALAELLGVDLPAGVVSDPWGERR